MHRNTICPFCFYTFSLYDSCFRCIVPTCTGRTPDTIYAETRGYNPVAMGHVIVPHKRAFEFGIPLELKCDICQHVSRTRLCPSCHFTLPHDVGQINQRIIALVGGRATGKTHYIASLVTRLQHAIGRNFDITVRLLGDDTQERWERDFYIPLFVHKTVLQPTLPAGVDAQIKSPLIFRLTFTRGRQKHALNISFFDSAGEDLTSLTTMSLQNRSIAHADGIIFLLDPLQIPSVRSLIPDTNAPQADVKASPEYMAGRLRDFFERERGLRATEKVKVPVAFTLSKLDTLFPLLEAGSEFHHPGGHDGYLDLDDVQSVHTEISNYLASWINPNFCGIIHNSFARYNYFGVSSLGSQPDAGNHLSTISPLRVEDPFLWILFQHGLIQGMKRG
jgi:hypothetical protein